MDINAIVNDLRDQLDRINRAIHALEGSSSNGRRGRRSGATLRASNGRKRKRRLSTAARKRISEAAKADRKSTRLNSSHSQISYAVFCLKKKKKKRITHI